MGQNQSNTAGSTKSKTARKKKPQESDESDADESPTEVNEADPYIIANVRYEKPSGQPEERRFRIGTSESKAADVKKNLEQKFGITPGRIQVYLEGGETEMPDECTLYELGLINDVTLLVRDSSLKYK